MKCIVAEFDRLPLYFPIYLGIRKSFFKNYGLRDIKFIDTYSDLSSYLNLVSRRATVGVADPIFSISKDKIPKGEIIGVLVKRIPIIIAALPGKPIKNIQDLINYKIATYPKFTTCHTIASYLLGEKVPLIEIPYKQIIQALINKEVDVAFILPEQLIEPLIQVFSLYDLFPRYLFTGLIQVPFSNTVEQSIELKLGLRDSLKYLHSNKEESLKLFCEEFPALQRPREVFETYLSYWSENGALKEEEWKNAFKVWSHVYKNIFRVKNPSSLFQKKEEKIIITLTAKKICRDYPYDIPRMLVVIKKSLYKKQRIKLIGFWGASDKVDFETSEKELISQLSKLRDELLLHCRKVSITFLLSDMHAIMNGYDKQKVRRYLSLVKEELYKKNMRAIFLSKLWKDWGITKTKIIKIASRTDIHDYGIYRTLIKQSKKHFHLGNKLFGAKEYYSMRKVEAPFIKNKFPNSILFSYTDSKTREFLPDMPTLFFYTTKRDKNDLPWFQK